MGPSKPIQNKNSTWSCHRESGFLLFFLMCQHSHFWSLVSRQKREEHFRLFYKFHWRLQTPAVSSTLHAFQKMPRSGRRALVVFGGGLRWQNVFFSFLLFALDLSTLISASLLSCCQQKICRRWAAEQLHSSERQEEHFKELWGSLVTLLFKANPFLAIIPGFVHRKGDLFYHSSDRDVKINTAAS